jgi:YafQ family addiction module toxin component
LNQGSWLQVRVSSKDLKSPTTDHRTAPGVVIALLQADDPLPKRCRPHPLVGIWTGYMECHVKPNLLLIWKVVDDELRLARIGSHAKLFR